MTHPPAGPGIYHGSLSYSSQEPGDGVIDSAQLLPYPAQSQAVAYAGSPYAIQSRQSAPNASNPISMALTAYHVMVLYPNALRVVRPLDDKVVFEEQLDLVRAIIPGALLTLIIL